MIGARFHRKARADVDEAIQHYFVEAPGFAPKFRRQLERAVDFVCAFPRIGSPGIHGTRKWQLRGFPYAVIYLVEPNEVLIVAVAHASRRSDYWLERLTE